MVELSDEHYPIITVRWSGVTNLAEFEDFYAKYQLLLKRAERDGVLLANVMDATQQKEVEPAARKALGDLADLGPHFLGTWAVMGAIARLVLTALKWTGNSQTKSLTVVKSLPEAFQLAADALRAKGIKLAAHTEKLYPPESKRVG